MARLSRLCRVTCFRDTTCDEARHIDVFSSARGWWARAGHFFGDTSRSLLSHLRRMISPSAFLLQFLERNVLRSLNFYRTARAGRADSRVNSQAKGDESRHVHFGLAHVRYGLATIPRFTPGWKRRAKTRCNTSRCKRVPARFKMR